MSSELTENPPKQRHREEILKGLNFYQIQHLSLEIWIYIKSTNYACITHFVNVKMTFTHISYDF